MIFKIARSPEAEVGPDRRPCTPKGLASPASAALQGVDEDKILIRDRASRIPAGIGTTQNEPKYNPTFGGSMRAQE